MIVGAGKVGAALARGLRAREGVGMTLLSARAVLAGVRASSVRGPKAAPLRAARRAEAALGRATLVLVCARDAQVAPLAACLAALVPAGTPVLHSAGALGPEALAALAPARPVGVAHPLLSFASPKHPPRLAGGALGLAGDPRALRAGRALARALGMIALARKPSGGETARYHAAAALLANGAAALAATALGELEALGLPRAPATRALAALLASVADNVAALGLPAALSGPVRRGDVATVARHLAAQPPAVAALYRALVAAQLPLAERLGEATPAALRALRARLGGGVSRAAARRGSGRPGRPGHLRRL